MRWLLVGLCGLALVNLSAPLPQAPRITQIPRFYGVYARSSVVIYCESPLKPPLQVDWFWAKDSDQEAKKQMRPNTNVVIKGKKPMHSAFLLLKDVSPSDSGVYYCKVNGTRGPGTGLQVMRRQKSSKMKDALIILQALMLASCIAAPLVQKYILVKKDEAIYEDPQQDHTYEGLMVETCEGALYEDISAYAQTGGPGAPWEN